MHKADLSFTDSASPDEIALDETVLWIDDQQFSLLETVDPEPAHFLHARLIPANTAGLTEIFLGKHQQKYDAETRLILIDSAPWLKAALHRRWLQFRYKRPENRKTVKHIFNMIRNRNSSFSYILVTLIRKRQNRGSTPSTNTHTVAK